MQEASQRIAGVDDVERKDMLKTIEPDPCYPSCSHGVLTSHTYMLRLWAMHLVSGTLLKKRPKSTGIKSLGFSVV